MLTLFRFVWNHPLNRTNRAAALGRVLRWQIASRLMRRSYVTLPFVGGSCLMARKGMTGATGNWYCGLDEVDEMAFVLHVTQQGDNFLDVGANVGSYSILAAVAGCRVTAVEPIPTTLQHLRNNAFLNRLDIHTPHVGLSSASGVLRFTMNQDSVNHVVVEGESGPSLEVPVTTMDELVAGSCPVVIKIDVEGHELSVLRGGRDTLGNPALLALIIETNGSGKRYGVDDAQLIEELGAYGFQPYGYDPFSRKLIDVKTDSINTIFIRDSHAVRSRLSSARTFQLVNGQI